MVTILFTSNSMYVYYDYLLLFMTGEDHHFYNYHYILIVILITDIIVY